MNCDLCSSQKTSVVAQLSPQTENTPLTFVKCDSCGLVRAGDLHGTGLYYTNSQYVEGAWFKGSRALQLIRNTVLRLTGVIRGDGTVSVPAGSRVLDVGCGRGSFLHRQEKKGMEVYGVEPSADGACYARVELDLEVYQGTLRDAALPSDFFDVVYMNHVLEHLTDPVETVRECRRVLKPGGVLVIETPDACCLEAQVFRGNWHSYNAAGHIRLFSSATFRLLFQRTGFEVESVSHQASPASVLGSMWILLRGKGANAWASATCLGFMFVPVLIASITLSWAGKSGHLKVIGKKNPFPIRGAGE